MKYLCFCLLSFWLVVLLAAETQDYGKSTESNPDRSTSRNVLKFEKTKDGSKLWEELQHDDKVKREKTNELFEGAENDTERERKYRTSDVHQTPQEIRDYMVTKLADIYSRFRDRGATRDVTLNNDELPILSDVLPVKNMTKKYKLAEMTFHDVKIHGMSGFQESQLFVDPTARTAHLMLVSRNLTITGNYTLSNFIQHTASEFTILLLGNVTYMEYDNYCEHLNDVDLEHTKVTIRYGFSKSEYKDIGLVTQVFSGMISNKLLDDVLIKAGREISRKLRHVIKYKIRNEVIFPEQKNRVNAMEETIRSVVAEGHKYMERLNITNIFLNGSEKIQASKLTALIYNVSLNGINSFHMVGNVSSTFTADDKVQLDVTVEISPCHGTLQVSYYDSTFTRWEKTYDNILIEYDIERIFVNISLKKTLYSDDDITISNVNLTVSNLKPNLNSFSGELGTLFQDKLAENVSQMIAQNLPMPIEVKVNEILNDAKILMEKSASEMD